LHDGGMSLEMFLSSNQVVYAVDCFLLDCKTSMNYECKDETSLAQQDFFIVFCAWHITSST